MQILRPVRKRIGILLVRMQNPRKNFKIIADLTLLPLASFEVVSEGLGLVNGLLLALGVVRVDLRRSRVASRLTAAETLARPGMDVVHLDHCGTRGHELRRRFSVNLSLSVLLLRHGHIDKRLALLLGREENA